jgi:hypothetical protein
MRKVLSTLLIAGALVAALTSLASGATGKRCGTLYKPPCTKPTITVHSLPPACTKPGATITLPTIKFSSNAGIHKVTVKLGSKVLKSKTFSGRGPTHYSIKGLKVSTKGLKGSHTITISVRDINGRTASRTLRFNICAVKPVFTG